MDPTTVDITSTGIDLSPSHLFMMTVPPLVLSHFGANYLKTVTPRGYLFWFTILNIIFGFMFM